MDRANNNPRGGFGYIFSSAAASPGVPHGGKLGYAKPYGVSAASLPPLNRPE